MTKDQSPYIAVHDVDPDKDVPGIHREQDRSLEVPLDHGIGHHLDIVRDPSLSNLLHLIATVNAHPLRIFNSHWTNLQSDQFFRLLPGGLANNPRGTMTQRMALIILSSPPVTSGNHGANRRTTPTTLLPDTNALGKITNNLPTVMPLPHTTPPTNHSPHFLHQ